jgi:hypothetical protein
MLTKHRGGCNMLSPRQCLQLPLLISVVTLTLAACSAIPKSHTPPAFFWKASDSFGPSSTLHGPETEQLIRFYGSDIQRKHRFMLEIAAGSLVSNLEASVNVNGIEHPMLPSDTPLAQKLWTYDSGECNAKYVYFYRLKWRVPVFGEQTLRDPAGSENYEVTVDGFVDGFKEPVWYPLGRALPNTMTKQKFLAISLHGPRGFVKLRNQLDPTTSLRIEDIKLDPSSADKDKFGVHKPPLPVVLNCGDEIAFEIKWKAQLDDYDPAKNYDNRTTIFIYYASTPDEGKTWVPVADPYRIPVQTFPTLFQYEP